MISLIGGILFAYDKRLAVKRKRRISERTLLGWAAAGAAPVQWLISRQIRHKTKVKKFQVMLPLFSVGHAALLGWILYGQL
ncbi:DUF1294 domain-containing protein [Alkalicoccus urumqiensis]|uniref:DUF1294 domain-containing protein n=1 Tax=Alkalicoccus urumqiensis TaxID=1548213 RepID=A0A2P6MDE7_ALKUR|nr:DUF1294 domain-containing protein [Alkalicoccus urumqiensis]PRO64297.1 DUF1294 domain-containing protein [Alkalicoccus urumqiensis]